MSTESTQNDEIFVNAGSFCVDSVDVESHSALTQLMGSLSVSTQYAEDESSRKKRHTKPALVPLRG
jgi:hypothetical protein